jgi:alpha-beta hydrolase superfamily lysophospholipase
VLRYDKRTKVHGAKMAKLDGMTVREETIDDALLAVKHLRERAEIDRKRIFVLGHSLGAMLAPRIAKRDETVAGLIILAGPTRPLGDLMVEQFEYIFSLDGKLSTTEKKKIESLKKTAALVKSPELTADTPRSMLFPGAPASYWLDLRGYRPAEVARGIDRPMLILQGERDYQVTMADFRGWKEALGERDNVRLESFPALNHLFIPGKGPSTPREYQQPGHVDEAVIRTIVEWIESVR